MRTGEKDEKMGRGREKQGKEKKVHTSSKLIQGSFWRLFISVMRRCFAPVTVFRDIFSVTLEG